MVKTFQHLKNPKRRCPNTVSKMGVDVIHLSLAWNFLLLFAKVGLACSRRTWKTGGSCEQTGETHFFFLFFSLRSYAKEFFTRHQSVTDTLMIMVVILIVYLLLLFDMAIYLSLIAFRRTTLFAKTMNHFYSTIDKSLLTGNKTNINQISRP